MAFFFFDYAKMAAALDKKVSDAIQDINRDFKISLIQDSSAGTYTNKFIPDYLINRDGKPFLIIEYKSQLSSLSDSLFTKGLSEWGSYGILTNGKEYKVYGRESYSVIASCADLKSAIRYLLKTTESVKAPKNPEEDVNLACNFIIALADKHLKSKRRDDVVKLVDGWKKASERFFEIENGAYVLTDEAELSIFRALLGSAKQELCRYSSFRSVFRMLSNKKIYLNNIMNMNDKTEGSYFDDYVSKSDTKNEMLANKMEYFIFSCSDAKKVDDFDMWRLYGDDTKGCCMVFSHRKIDCSGFKIFPVNYAQKGGIHPEVEFINNLVTNNLAGGRRIVIKNLNEWKLFFKPYEYKNEREVRILYGCGQDTINFEEEYFINEQYGIASKSLAYGFSDFPLKLEGIILGPGLPEKEANMAMLEELLRKCIKDRKIPISYFDCMSYRV